MKKQNDGGAAFPNMPADSSIDTWDSGMTLRAYFAAKTMQGLLAQSGDFTYDDKELALDSVKYADALIKELGE